jgi:hypothetical protein
MAPGGHGDYGQTVEANIVSQFSNHTETVQNGHLQIQEHQIRLIVVNQIQSLAAIDGFLDGAA